MLGLDKLYYQAGAGPEVFQHLEDGGFIEREYHGDSYRFRVVVFCSCGGNPLKVAPGDSEPVLSLRDGTGEPPMGSGFRVGDDVFGLSSQGFKSKSVQKPINTVQLARDYFPQVMAGTGMRGIRLQSNWPALAKNLKLWKVNYGATITSIQQMMDEFARHPEWCRASNKPPWRIFLAKRDELATLAAAQQARDPGNRKYSAGQGRDYWFGRHTPRAYSPA